MFSEDNVEGKQFSEEWKLAASFHRSRPMGNDSFIYVVNNLANVILFTASDLGRR